MPLTEVHLSQFQQLVERFGSARAASPGDHLLRQGERSEQIIFVREGLLKAYYIRADGKEHIKSFQPEGAIIGSMVDLIDKGPCTFSLVAIEPSSIVALPYARLEEAAREDLGLANALVGFLSQYGKRKERREYELLCLSPEDRYRQFLDEAPGLADRISQADLAAYIGITPQALSRIKRRMAS